MIAFHEWCARWNVPREALAELLVPAQIVSDEYKPQSEQYVQQKIRLEAATRGVRLWRNNSGAYQDQDGRVVRYGLGNDSAKLNEVFKSSDLIGIAPGGRFLAVEVKNPEWKGPSTPHEMAQAAFLTAVQQAGGVAGFAKSTDDFQTILTRP